MDPNKRKYGDPGIRLEQLMRFFDPKLARKLDDSDQVRTTYTMLTVGLLFRLPLPICLASFGRKAARVCPRLSLFR